VNLKKKIGPLPVWAWGVILGVGAYFLYERYRAGSAASSSSDGTTGILDPNAVDPNTGLTYGAEEADALNANASQLAGSGGSALPDESGLTGSTPGTDEIGDLIDLLGALNGAGFTYNPNAVTSDATTAAANSPAVQGSSPPTSSASSHTVTQIDTHPGGPFYTWYVKVFGKPPPAHVPSNGAAYTLWKNGVSVASAKTLVANSGSPAATTVTNTIANAGKAIQPTKPKPAKPKPVKVKGP
jgi:hypothetical protein